MVRQTDNRIEGEPPYRSLKRAEIAAWCGAGISLVATPLFPAAILLTGAVAPASGLAAWWIRKKYLAIREREKDLGGARKYDFPNNQIPIPTDEHGRPRKPDSYWVAEFPPFIVERSQDQRGEVLTEVWIKRLRPSCPEWQKVLDQQPHWLIEHANDRWNAVIAWWEEWYLRPLLIARHGSAEKCSKKDIDSAAEFCRVDLCCGVAIAGQETLWKRSMPVGWEGDSYRDLQTRLLSLPNKGLIAASTPPPDFPVWRHPRYEWIFIGRGALWDQEHAQAYEEEVKSKNLSDITSAAPEQGDPRTYGLISRIAKPLFIPRKQLNQMCGIGGSNGVGKTVYASVLSTQVTRNGWCVTFVDPKSDEELLNRMVEEARLTGRAHQFRYFSLASPMRKETWDFLAKYNPCWNFVDVSELASRIAVCIPKTKDPFWFEAGKAMVERCLTLCHWSNWWLRYLGQDRETGTLPDRDSTVTPMCLLAMQWARHHTGATPQDAEKAVLRIREKMKIPGWRPENEADREIFVMTTMKSLADQPIYSPNEWIPSLRQICEYQIDNTSSFVGLMLRIFFPHLYLASHQIAAPEYPRVASSKAIFGKEAPKGNAQPTMRSVYEASARHPVEAWYEDNVLLAPDQERWAEFYDYFLPNRDTYKLKEMFNAIRRQLSAQFSDSELERKEFIQYCFTLKAALQPFIGQKARIMCAPKNDINWAEVIDEDLIVYFGLASMQDKKGASAAAKLVTEDYAAFLGRRYQYENYRNAKPIFLFSDEAATWINESFIDLLNKGRGAGLHAMILFQETAGLTEVLASANAAKMVKGNLNSFVQLRSMLLEDAEDFSKRTGKVNIIQEGRNINMTPGVGSAGHKDIRAFSSSEGRNFSRREVFKVDPGALLQLPIGQAFLHTMGQVYLIHQGMLSSAQTRYPEEIGYKPGVMRLPLTLPIKKRDPSTTSRQPSQSPSSSPVSTKQHSNPIPSNPASKTPTPTVKNMEMGGVADSQTRTSAGTAFRPQTDQSALLVRADDLSADFPEDGSTEHKKNAASTASNVDAAQFDEEATNSPKTPTPRPPTPQPFGNADII